MPSARCSLMGTLQEDDDIVHSAPKSLHSSQPRRCPPHSLRLPALVSREEQKKQCLDHGYVIQPCIRSAFALPRTGSQCHHFCFPALDSPVSATIDVFVFPLLFLLSLPTCTNGCIIDSARAGIFAGQYIFDGIVSSFFWSLSVGSFIPCL